MNRNQINLDNSFPIAYDENSVNLTSLDDTSCKFVPLYENFADEDVPLYDNNDSLSYENFAEDNILAPSPSPSESSTSIPTFLIASPPIRSPTPTRSPSPSTPVTGRLIASMPVTVPVPINLQSEYKLENKSNSDIEPVKLKLSSVNSFALSAKTIVPSQEYLRIQREKEGVLSTVNLVRIGFLLVVIIIAIFIYFKMNNTYNVNNN